MCFCLPVHHNLFNFSSIFGKSFHFPFPYFVIYLVIFLEYIFFPMLYWHWCSSFNLSNYFNALCLTYKHWYTPPNSTCQHCLQFYPFTDKCHWTGWKFQLSNYSLSQLMLLGRLQLFLGVCCIFIYVVVIDMEAVLLQTL